MQLTNQVLQKLWLGAARQATLATEMLRAIRDHIQETEGEIDQGHVLTLIEMGLDGGETRSAADDS